MNAISTKPLPTVGIHVVRGHQEARRGAEAGEADAEAHREHVIDVDADEARALPLLRHGANRAAEVGPRDQQEQRRGHRQGSAEGGELGDRDQGAEDVDGGERVGRLDRPGVGAKDVQRDVLHHDGQSERDEQDVLVPAVARPADHESLQRVAQREHGAHHDGQGEERIDAEPGEQEVDAVQRDHQRRAVREVDDVQDPVDEGQPERDQRIDGALGQAVQEGGERGSWGRPRDGCSGRALPPQPCRTRRASFRRDRLGARTGGQPFQGNTGAVSAYRLGSTTRMFLSRTCIVSGCAPVFWPLTNRVGP